MLINTQSLRRQPMQQQKQLTAALHNLNARTPKTKSTRAVAGTVIRGQQARSDQHTATAATQRANTPYSTLMKTRPKGALSPESS
jgi:hypothetical protein